MRLRRVYLLTRKFRVVNLTLTNIYKYIFFVFIFFNCIFYREFSYVSIGGVYVTEFFLTISAIFFSLIIILRRDFRFKKESYIWLLFFVWSSILLIQENGSLLEFKAREYATIVYSVFFLITIIILNSKKSCIDTALIICVASFFSILYIFMKSFLGLGYGETTTESVIRYGNSEFVGIILLYSIFLEKILNSKLKPLSLFIVMICVIVVIFFIVHRSASLALMASSLVIYLFKKDNEKSKKRYVYIILIVSALGMLFVFSGVAQQVISRTINMFSFDVLNDPNVSWRMLVWVKVFQVMSFWEWIYGVGWGYEFPAFMMGDRSYSLDGHVGIHNSIIFIFFHTGLLGVGMLFFLIYKVYSKAIRLLKTHKSSPLWALTLSLFSAHIGVFVFSLFNVVLEGPYMSIVFWVYLGLIANLTHLMERESILVNS